MAQAPLSRTEFLTRFNTLRAAPDADAAPAERATAERTVAADSGRPKQSRSILRHANTCSPANHDGRDRSRDLSALPSTPGPIPCSLLATPCREKGEYRSVPTAKKARATLVARRVQLQSELNDLHAALGKVHTHTPGGDAHAEAEAAFVSSQSVVAELAQARGSVKDVDAQIAAVDEWLALQAAKSALDEEKPVECAKCASLVPRIIALEEAAAQRAESSGEAIRVLQISAQRNTETVEEKVEDLRALEEDMRLAAAKASDELTAWKAEERACQEKAAAARAKLLADLPNLLKLVHEQQQTIQDREEEFLQLRTAYNAVAQQSLAMLQAVEEDRKSVSQMSPWVRQEGSLVRDANEKIRWWTTCKEEIEQKLVRTEERLKLVEKAQVPNLEPKIHDLEERLKHVTEEEQKLQAVCDRNTAKLKEMEKKCNGVSNWMRELAAPKGGNESESDGAEEIDVQIDGDANTSMHAKVDVVDKHHHHHQVRVDKDHHGHLDVRVDE